MTDDILRALAAPFAPDVISWRVGSTTKDKAKGMALAYIDARDVQDRLDQVCGVNWQVRHPWASEKKLACEIGIKIDGEWVWRGDGAGDSDVEAEKGAFSDSFKRAGVRWGVGRYLYDIDSPWVELTAKGNSYVIAEGAYARLRSLLAKGAGSAPAGAPAQRQPPAPATPPASTAQRPAADKRAPRDLKYELLGATSDLLEAFATPDEWFRGLYAAIKRPNAPVAALYDNNRETSRVMEDSNPDLSWEIGGKKYHPAHVIESAVTKLVPGLVP